VLLSIHATYPVVTDVAIWQISAAQHWTVRSSFGLRTKRTYQNSEGKMETPHAGHADSLRKLYFTRTVFQVLWAGSVIATAVTKPAIAGVLLILYPLWDVACTVYDLNTSALEGSARTSQIINAVLGTATAIGIAFTIFQQPAYAIGIFGAWAFGAGLLQLTAGLIRRKQLGGQWAMILSGLQSMAAGTAFGLGGLQGKFHAKDLGGYAIFGAVYFLVAGILLSRKLSRATAAA
jgi:hypothetical protein